MKRRWYAGFLVLGLIFALCGCGNKGQSEPDSTNPLQFGDVPAEAQPFDWSQVVTDPAILAQGLDNYPTAVSDWTIEGLNLETGGELPAFNFGEDTTQYQSIEGDPNEIPLESGMPLEGSNTDPNLGVINPFPSLQPDTNTESGSANDTEPAETPKPEFTPQPTAGPVKPNDSESLAKTADMPLIVYSLFGVAVLGVLIAVLKKSTQDNN